MPREEQREYALARQRREDLARRISDQERRLTAAAEQLRHINDHPPFFFDVDSELAQFAGRQKHLKPYLPSEELAQLAREYRSSRKQEDDKAQALATEERVAVLGLTVEQMRVVGLLD